MMSDTVKRLTPPRESGDLIEWIETHLTPSRPWLLAHADDGVIWGRCGADGRLITSHEVAPAISPPLHWLTLQQAFIFGPESEARLRRVGDAFHAALLTDPADYMDESHILWGTIVVNSLPKGFTHVREARQQGLDHVVPVEVTGDQLRARLLRLRVRHFIARDADTGAARISGSRLISIDTRGEQ